jgi:hypothetical protein
MPKLFEDPVTKEKKVPGVFDIQSVTPSSRSLFQLLEDGVTEEQKVPVVFDRLAFGVDSEKRSNFKQIRAERGVRGESCAKVIRYRSW